MTGPAAGGGCMATILIIDDDKDFSGLAAAHFSPLGYIVAQAFSGAEGLSKAAALKPDIVFLDIMMPDMNGIEVLRELRAGDETSDIPVIMMSAKYLDDGVMGLFAQEGNFRAFLAKPVSLAALQKKVEALLGK